MKITVKSKDIELSIDDNNINTIIQYPDQNTEVIRLLKAISEECCKIIKERN